jgi:Dolichyl-phosphate-mannose-protein mannosyltransferase
MFGRSELAAVGLSLVFGVALIPLMYYVAARLFNWRVGLYAAALAAVSPPLIQLSILVRPYAMLSVFCVLTAYLLWECLREEGEPPWVVYGIAMVVMLYTHNWALLLFGAHGLIALIWLTLRAPSVRKELLRPWLLTQACILIFYAPWVRVLVHQFFHAGHGVRPSFETGPYILAARVLVGAKPAYALALLLLAGLAGWLRWRRTRAQPRGVAIPLALGIAAGIPVIVITLTLALSWNTNLLTTWCVAVLSPLVLFVFARFLAWVHESGAWREAYLAGAGLLALYAVTWFRDPESVKSNARETAMAVARRAQPGDLVIVTPETLASSFNYYFRPKNPQIDFPSMRRKLVVRYDNRLRRMTSVKALATALGRIDAARERGQRVWFVMEASDMSDRYVRTLSPEDTARGYLKPMVLKRSNELRQHLIGLYGPPTLTLMPAHGDQALELLGALLFEPVPQSNAGAPTERVPCRITIQLGRQDHGHGTTTEPPGCAL